MARQTVDSKKEADITRAKNWVSKYRENEIELDNQIERLQNLIEKNEGTSVYSSRPKSEEVDEFDELIYAGYYIKKEEVNDYIQNLIGYQKRYRAEIENVLLKLNNPYERAVIRIRYIDVEEWSEVCRVIFGTSEDYDEKFDSYTRRMYNIHGSALANIADILSGEKPNHSLTQNE